MKLAKTLSRLAVGLSAAAIIASSAPAVAKDLVMWERSGGNAKMVDTLVAMWNEKNPDRKINLTYIPHAEMVAKLAQAIASGEVPDLMGMDLIYAPQFEKAGQLVDITDKIKDWPELKTASPGHMTVATYRRTHLRRAALRRRLGALLQQGPVREGRPRPEQAADEPGRDARRRRQDHRARRRHQGLLPAGLLRRLQHLHRRPADVGVGRQDRGHGPATSRSSAMASRRCCSGARHGQGGQRPRERPRRERRDVPMQFGSGKVGMMGTGNFNIKLARDQNPNMKFGITLLPGVEPGSAASFIGGDLVVVPKGSKRVDDAVDFMKFILSDEVQVEGYAKLLNLTTRADMVDNKYFKAEPLVQDVAKALTVGRTPYTLTFFEQINSPQGRGCRCCSAPTTPTIRSTRSSPTRRSR